MKYSDFRYSQIFCLRFQWNLLLPKVLIRKPSRSSFLGNVRKKYFRSPGFDRSHQFQREAKKIDDRMNKLRQQLEYVYTWI